MRLLFTLILLISATYNSSAQKLTGIWRGYFVQKQFNPFTGKFIEEKYKYEVQINHLENNAVEGVTYSYKTTVFYGKAAFKGLYTAKTKNLVIKELKMLELKTSDQSVPCVMTCYLDYSKVGKLEMLSGTFTSVNTDRKEDCGDGTLYLEKVKESDFEVEPFLLNHNKEKSTLPKKEDGSTAGKTNTLKGGGKRTESNSRSKDVKSNKSATTSHPKNTADKKLPAIVKPKHTVKPGAEEFVVKKQNIPPVSLKKDSLLALNPPEPPAPPKDTIQPRNADLPKVLLERKNPLVNTLQVDVQDVKIDYYDNGQIDNDTISVYHNNEEIINHGRLSYTPLSINIHLDEKHPVHEIVTVAENLGDVPPNTALMVITAGKKRFEIFITSDEKRNAKVLIEYKPNEGIKLY
ncbi:MAG: hypothetical protein KGO81_12525 [Bacteroidota bacterium]|nr:hypothetical protein [Bacteroidota bacterium]